MLKILGHICNEKTPEGSRDTLEPCLQDSNDHPLLPTECAKEVRKGAQKMSKDSRNNAPARLRR